MRLRTPRRRSDGFSQVRAAPGRPTHQLRVAPSSLPPPIRPYVCQSAEFPIVLTSDCRRLWAAAVRSTPRRGEASYPLSAFPAQLNLTSEPDQKSSSFHHLLRASFRTVTLALRGRDIRRWSYGRTLPVFDPLSWRVCDARRVCGRAPTSWRLKIADGASQG